MSKIKTYLPIVLLVIFFTATLYILEIPPFKKTELSNQKNTSEISSSIPNNQKTATQNGKVRNQTYSEHINRGALLENNNFYSLALAEYQQAILLDQNNPEAYIKSGKLQFKNRNYKEAEESFKKALAAKNKDFDATIWLSKTYLEERKFEAARDNLNQLDENNQTVKYYKGILLAFFGDYNNSKILFKKSIELSNDENLKANAQNFLNAYSEFDSNQGGEIIHLKTLLGRSMIQTGNFQTAIPLLFQVLKDKKDYRDAWILIGYAYLNVEKYQDAIEALEKARILDPLKADPFFYLGLSYQAIGDLQKALVNLEQAKKLNYQPTIQIEQKLGEIYLQLKEYDKSAFHYTNVVAMNNEDINYNIRPMWLYIEQLNQPESALRLAEKAVIAHPDSAMAYNLLGWAQIYNNQFDSAEKSLNQAIKIDENLNAVNLNYGKLYERKESYNYALSYYLKAHQNGRGDSIATSAAESYNQLIKKLESNGYNIKADLLSNN